MSLALLLGPQLQAFAANGYEVLTASAPGLYVPELERWGIGHVSLRHATRAAAPHRDLFALAELRSLFRRLRPDIVHTHNPKPGIYGRLAARTAGVPIIVNTVHGLYALPEDRWAKRTLVYGLERLAASCSHAELVQNPEDIPVLRHIGVSPDKLRLLGNGVDLARFDLTHVADSRVSELRQEFGAGPHDILCGAVGRLVWEKGYRELFAVADSLRERLPHARFVVVGPVDSAKADAIGDADLDRARASGIRFVGLRRDMAEVYAALDLYVLASHREGFPRSAMEASAMGLPVVATNIRGCRQVVDHGMTGLLVPPRHPEALAQAIVTLVENPERRREMAVSGRRKALEEFDDRRVIDTTLEVYERLLAIHNRRRPHDSSIRNGAG